MTIIKRSIARKLTILLTLFLLASCHSSKGWVYRSNHHGDIDSNDLKALVGKNIIIQPFADKRPGNNDDYFGFYKIPLMPFGFQDLNAPETTVSHVNSGMWVNFNPKDDFARAMVEELSTMGIFADIALSYSTKDSDYYIKGEIISTYYNGRILSYGFSVFGPMLWAVLPSTFVSNELEIKLSLIDSKSKNVIFSKKYKANPYTKLGWIYNIPNDFYYPEMLKTLYGEFVKDLLKIDFS